MRKSIKDALLNIMNSFREAHLQIADLVNNNRNDDALELIGNCRDTALQAKDIIGMSEGRDSVTVRAIDDYCEALGKAAFCVMNTGVLPEDHDIGLSVAENSIKKDIPVKIEVVFLPYKYSMWDSMESIWKAAVNDKRCDVYVVPIPYYDKNPDGTLGEYHYEGSFFTGGIPVIDHKTYNLEKRCPDIIYVHNPYDNTNTVTSVDPAYYSDKLKRCTGLLVYCPYYNYVSAPAESHRNLSLYYNMDYMIIQTEQHRKYYDESIDDDVFLPFGSPKFDRIINLVSKGAEIPSGWKEIINSRKVCLYNTSISDMADDPDAFLRKMEYVFRVFKEHSGYCLLWRPHPLLDGSIKNMYPQKYGIYTSLKRAFKAEHIGIYDDTPDPGISILAADSYIGYRRSSLASLFGVTGKPVFVLDGLIDRAPEKEDMIGQFIRFAYPDYDERFVLSCDGKLFFSENDDFTFRSLGVVSPLRYESSYSGVITIGENSYLIPRKSGRIVVIDPKNGSCEREIIIPDPDSLEPEFVGAVAVNRYIMLIPDNYDRIVCYNTLTGKFDDYDYPSDFVFAVNNNARIAGGYASHNGKLYCVSATDNRCIVIDPVRKEYNVIRIGRSSSSGYNKIISDAGRLWLLPVFGGIITEYDPAAGSFREYDHLDKQLCMIPGFREMNVNCLFSSCIYSGNKLYLFPNNINIFIVIDLNTGVSGEWLPPFGYRDETAKAYFHMYEKGYWCANTVRGGKKYSMLYDETKRKLYLISFEDNRAEEIKITFDEDDMNTYLTGFGRIDSMIPYACMEDVYNSLSDLLEDKISGKPYCREEQMTLYGDVSNNLDGSCGSKTHEFIMEKILDL